jgi:hypothetical protein
MKTVYKYPFIIDDEFSIEFPVGTKVLCWNFQNGVPCIWALIDPDETEKKTCHFRLAGTGHPIEESKWTDETNLVYINTVFLNEGSLVLHLFLIEVIYNIIGLSKESD